MILFFFSFFPTYSELNHKAYWSFEDRGIEGILEILLVRLEDMKTQMNKVQTREVTAFC